MTWLNLTKKLVRQVFMVKAVKPLDAEMHSHLRGKNQSSSLALVYPQMLLSQHCIIFFFPIWLMCWVNSTEMQLFVVNCIFLFQEQCTVWQVFAAPPRKHESSCWCGVPLKAHIHYYFYKSTVIARSCYNVFKALKNRH